MRKKRLHLREVGSDMRKRVAIDEEFARLEHELGELELKRYAIEQAIFEHEERLDELDKEVAEDDEVEEM
jgi:chaperonin cofactor prefoldin